MTIHKSICKVIALGVAGWMTFGCTGNFDDINKNPYGVTGEELERDGYNVGASLIGMQANVVPAQVHLHQFYVALATGPFSGYIAEANTWTEKFSTYNPPVNWERAPFNSLISALYPYYEQMHAVTDDPMALNLAKLIRVASMLGLTDTYGPIPYSKMSAAGGSEDALTAPYDSQETVYKTMIRELDEVVEDLEEYLLATPNFTIYDRVYGGDMTKWVKFANSLKLRMAIRMSYVEPALAKTTAESAVSHPVGVITSNSENAFYSVGSGTNPMWEEVASWGDHRAGADIICYMNGYNDPRIEKYFEPTTFGAANGYYGIPVGSDVGDKAIGIMYSAPVTEENGSIMWMNAAEVAFLRAEGALRGWSMGGTAESFYNQGISLSFEQHGASGADTYLSNASNTPQGFQDHPSGLGITLAGSPSSITIRWDESAGFETNLERIITQKWIANFPLGIESWAEYRRTGYPALYPIVNNKSGGIIPNNERIKRLQFPDTEYTENTANLMEAIQLLGGPDTRNTKLWWDKK